MPKQERQVKHVKVPAKLIDLKPRDFMGYTLQHLCTLDFASEPRVTIPEYMKHYKLSRNVRVKVFGKIVIVDDSLQGLILVYEYPHLLHISNHGCRDTHNANYNYKRM